MKGLKDDDEMQLNLDTLPNDQDNDQFIRMINTDDTIKMQIYKLRHDGSDDLVWDLHDWLEYNQDKTGQLIKNITR